MDRSTEILTVLTQISIDMGRIATALEAGDKGYQWTPDGLPICPKHHTVMKKRQMQGDTWYSHNVGTKEAPLWCRGHPGKLSPGFDVDADQEPQPRKATAPHPSTAQSNAEAITFTRPISDIPDLSPTDARKEFYRSLPDYIKAGMIDNTLANEMITLANTNGFTHALARLRSIVTA